VRMNRDQWVAGGVTLAAFACSAQHIYAVAVDAENPWPIALAHPLGLDGLIYIGIRAVQRGQRVAGWLATSYGVGMSLAFNRASYADEPLPTWVMALAMPAALVLAVLVVHGARDPEPAPVPMPRPATRRIPRAAQPDSAPEPVKTIPEPPEQHPEQPVHVQPDKPAEPPPADNPQDLPQGVHIRDGRRLRGTALHDDAEVLMRITPTMTIAELRSSYTPPLGQRTAEKISAKVRKPLPERVNGHDASALMP